MRRPEHGDLPREDGHAVPAARHSGDGQIGAVAGYSLSPQVRQVDPLDANPVNVKAVVYQVDPIAIAQAPRHVLAAARPHLVCRPTVGSGVQKRCVAPCAERLRPEQDGSVVDPQQGPLAKAKVQHPVPHVAEDLAHVANAGHAGGVHGNSCHRNAEVRTSVASIAVEGAVADIPRRNHGTDPGQGATVWRPRWLQVCVNAWRRPDQRCRGGAVQAHEAVVTPVIGEGQQVTAGIPSQA
mmetsp:Transcript_73041/g.225657  ORF Transcript_73041/g.225657 Transcript_73041/m.225657 type:complete len:239 (+) Transcript_73041:527-1243(+)